MPQIPTAHNDTNFTNHGLFHGIGAVLSMVVAAGPPSVPGSVRLYAAHTYDQQCLDIVAVDPSTGHTDVFSTNSAYGAWGIVVGADGWVYIGTEPNAHIMRVDWEAHALVDLGRPSSTEEYIWQLVVGTDEKIYGCTYPNAKLVRFDPKTGRGEDLGRMSSTQEYARKIAADDNGTVYVGIGTQAMDLVAFDIATGTHRSILPPKYVGQTGTFEVFRAADGSVYGHTGTDKTAWFKLHGQGASASPTTGWPGQALPACCQSSCTLAPNHIVSYDGRSITVSNGSKAHPSVHRIRTHYSGRPMDIFRLGMGPDGKLYGSTAEPINFFTASTVGSNWTNLHTAMESGEYYSFVAWKDKIIGAAYSADSPLSIYTPAAPWSPGENENGTNSR